MFSYFRFRSRSRAQYRVVAFVGLAVTLSLIPAFLHWQHNRTSSSALVAPASNSSAEILASVARNAVAHRLGRAVYPDSVVPGGVLSAAELRQATDHDPVVASHYAGFDYARAHTVRLKTAALMYVSYRKDGHVYWTRKPHLIPVGEKVITDGKKTARARCANQLSEKPHAATAPNEPTQEAMNRPSTMDDSMAVDVPPLSDLRSALMPPTQTGADPPLGDGGLPFSPIGAGGIFPPVGLTPSTPSTPVVPEPGTMILVASGLAAAYTLRKKKKL